jgi:Spy/CpxP family protein refolding chaperone
MKLKILMGALLFLIVLNVATIGTFLYIHFTRPPQPSGLHTVGPDGGRPFDGGGPHALHFRSKERMQLRKLMQDFHLETVDLHARLSTLEDETFALMQQDPVPRADVDSLLGELSTVRLEIMRKATDKLIEAKAFLTPEQEERFYSAILGMRPDRRGMKGPFHGGRSDRPFKRNRRGHDTR